MARRCLIVIFLPVAALGVVASWWVFGPPTIRTPPDRSASRAPHADAAQDDGDVTRVLLLGNSYAAGMIEPLRSLFLDDPDRSLDLHAITPVGRRLIEHVHDPRVEAAMAAGPWDAVVVQPQSQSPSASWINYRNAGTTLPAKAWFDRRLASVPVDLDDRRFETIDPSFWAGAIGLAERARREGVGRVVFLGTWPRHPDEWAAEDPFLGLFAAFGAEDGDAAATLMLEFNNAAADAWARRVGPSAEVARVGDAVFATLTSGDAPRLYASDHAHLTPAGYRLAAETFYRRLTGREARRAAFGK